MTVMILAHVSIKMQLDSVGFFHYTIMALLWKSANFLEGQLCFFSKAKAMWAKKVAL